MSKKSDYEKAKEREQEKQASKGRDQERKAKEQAIQKACNGE
jgi:hypothetical protein